MGRRPNIIFIPWLASSSGKSEDPIGDDCMTGTSLAAREATCRAYLCSRVKTEAEGIDGKEGEAIGARGDSSVLSAH